MPFFTTTTNLCWQQMLLFITSTVVIINTTHVKIKSTDQRTLTRTVVGMPSISRLTCCGTLVVTCHVTGRYNSGLIISRVVTPKTEMMSKDKHFRKLAKPDMKF